MSMEIIVSGSLPRPEVELSPSAFNAREVALSAAANIHGITCVSDLDDAAQALTCIKSLTRSIEDSRKEVKAPVLEVSRRIDATAKDYLTPLVDEAKRLSILVGSYQEAERRKAERVRQEAADAQAVAMAEMQVKQREAVLAGDEAAADAARAAAADLIAESQLSVIAAEGPRVDGITTRTSWRFEVVDIDSLHASRPDLCTIEVNGAAIRAIIKATGGKPIAGLRIWQQAGAIVRSAPAVNVSSYDY
jgi:hypothetical protein